ncbi:hypothetical protein OWR29_10875 [Actinoplanes sp. Pm04-4]|uniref:DNA mismatch repair proteins mutS family domain-containing protein n=1 Tax=Paractinoplanes pyxinae TaxID=2997416 RepID=A0ABT4AW92_9ACTN|nr:hypothetical protein [Actinoplanes pyxinae]MCY1138501.1 hypothetical protein [Actinoplanes pyxinae]
MRGWLAWLRQYQAGSGFAGLAAGARGLLTELGELEYTLTLSGAEVVAGPFSGQEDLGAATLSLFARFGSDGAVAAHEFDLRAGAEMGQLQGAVLDLVVQLFPDVFERVGKFLDDHPTVWPSAVGVVERDLQFALSWLAFTAAEQTCLPEMRPEPALHVTETYDLMLARRSPPVTNDADLAEGEQMLVVTGPNQGGKTTFARTVGQLYHLAALGLPVPGCSAVLHPPDAILTHFDRGDRAGDLESRLEDEVNRMAGLLTEVGPRSVVILNEMFSSTTWVDARAMSTDVLRTVLDAGAIGVCVTFIDELSRLDPRVVSLVAGIDEHDVTARTFKVSRGRADGAAHAVALAAKYGLTRDQLRSRS